MEAWFNTHHHAIFVPPSMCPKLFARTKTSWTNVHAVAGLADWVRALDANRVREVARAAVALDLHAGLVHSCTPP